MITSNSIDNNKYSIVFSLKREFIIKITIKIILIILLIIYLIIVFVNKSDTNNIIEYNLESICNNTCNINMVIDNNFISNNNISLYYSNNITISNEDSNEYYLYLLYNFYNKTFYNSSYTFDDYNNNNELDIKINNIEINIINNNTYVIHNNKLLNLYGNFILNDSNTNNTISIYNKNNINYIYLINDSYYKNKLPLKIYTIIAIVLIILLLIFEIIKFKNI